MSWYVAQLSVTFAKLVSKLLTIVFFKILVKILYAKQVCDLDKTVAFSEITDAYLSIVK